MGLPVCKSYLPMSVLIEQVANIEKLPKSTSKKTEKRIPMLTRENFDAFCDHYNLSEYQSNLIKLVHFDGCTFAQIAAQVGCSRQNIHQAYTGIYNRVMREVVLP